MASSGKKKTTMAKLMRETRLRERRVAKKARKDDRKRNALSAADQSAEVSNDSALAADVDEQSVDAGVGMSD